MADYAPIGYVETFTSGMTAQNSYTMGDNINGSITFGVGNSRRIFSAIVNVDGFYLIRLSDDLFHNIYPEYTGSSYRYFGCAYLLIGSTPYEAGCPLYRPGNSGSARYATSNYSNEIRTISYRRYYCCPTFYAGSVSLEKEADSTGIFAEATLQISTYDRLFALLDSLGVIPLTDYNIAYVPINCSLSGPKSVRKGAEVNVKVTFPNGYRMRELSDGTKAIQILTKYGTVRHIYDTDTQTITFEAP